MKSPYRNPYANPKVEAARAAARKRSQSLMMNVAIWSSVPATIITVLAVVAANSGS